MSVYDDSPADTFRFFDAMPSSTPVTSFGSCGCTPDSECEVCNGTVEMGPELARAARQDAQDRRTPVDVGALWERYAGIPRDTRGVA